MAVLGIMAAGLFFLINPLGQFQKTNDARRKSDLEQLQRTLETYYNDNGRYPAHSTSTNWAGCPNNTYIYRIRSATGCIDWGTSWDAYKTTVPKDPTPSTRTYVYYAAPDGQSYYLYANLERGASDPQACTGGVVCTGSQSMLGTLTWLTLINKCRYPATLYCNYGVSSPNVSP